MYTGFGRIILHFIPSFFLSSLNNFLIPAITIFFFQKNWILRDSAVFHHSEHPYPHSGAQQCFKPLQAHLPTKIGRVTQGSSAPSLAVVIWDCGIPPWAGSSIMEPHPELDPQTDLAKEDEERETMKVQANHSDDCSVKNNNNHNEGTQTQPTKQENSTKGRREMCGFR